MRLRRLFIHPPRFEPRDLWRGVYWTTEWEGPDRWLRIYWCPLPLFPILVEWRLESLLDRPLVERDPVVAKWLGEDAGL